MRRKTAALLLLIPSVAYAQAVAQQPAPDAAAPTVLPQVEVIGATPLLGSGIDRNKVPGETAVLNSADLARDGNADLLRALNEQVPGVTLDNAAGNPLQPNLLYHGFTASPLQGNAQGLAVYLNGVRFNQAFGDTVNWELIPDIAIDRVNIEGANPVFGLNALGGALSVQTKNGFTYQGAEASVLGGSFGRIEGQFQYGVQRDDTAAYIAGTVLHEGGWRNLQSSDLYNILGDLGWRSDIAELHITVVAADSALNGPGTSPVQLLAADPAAQFTAPNLIADKYLLLSATGSTRLAANTALQTVVYYSNFQQRVANGNITNFGSCNTLTGLLCEAGTDTPATDRAGNPIPDFLSGGPYSDLDRQSTSTNGYGASAQVTNKDAVFGHANQLVVGASYDGAATRFSANTLIGGLTPDSRLFIGPGIAVDQADGSNAPVRVGITSNYGGVFLTDTLDLTDRLSLTAAGRLNLEQIDLHDEIGTALDGSHGYVHFNPSVGLTYKLFPWLTAYASYAVSNRAPTPAELSCASAAAPCSLANFFVGDPGLKQVVGRTEEAGLRGQTRLPALDEARISYNLGLFRTDLADDILFVNSPVQGRAFFENVGDTRRQGVDAGLALRTGRWRAYANYSYTDATFQSGFVASSQNNPGADANGDITIRPGNALPGVPAHLGKFGLAYQLTEQWSVGVTGTAAAGQYLFGDEANLQAKLPGYVVFNLNTSYRINEHVQVFGEIENITDRKYYTYGTFTPTSAVFLAQAPNATDPRAYSPAAPVGGFAGLRVTF